MQTATEKAFNAAMVNIYETAKREVHYNATRFLQMLSEHGGVATAKRLMHMDDTSSGFGTLWLAGRLDLTVEAHMLRPQFVELFEDDELQEARNRLERANYAFPD